MKASCPLPPLWSAVVVVEVLGGRRRSGYFPNSRSLLIGTSVDRQAEGQRGYSVASRGPPSVKQRAPLSARILLLDVLVGGLARVDRASRGSGTRDLELAGRLFRHAMLLGHSSTLGRPSFRTFGTVGVAVEVLSAQKTLQYTLEFHLNLLSPHRIVLLLQQLDHLTLRLLDSGNALPMSR